MTHNSKKVKGDNQLIVNYKAINKIIKSRTLGQKYREKLFSIILSNEALSQIHQKYSEKLFNMISIKEPPFQLGSLIVQALECYKFLNSTSIKSQS